MDTLFKDLKVVELASVLAGPAVGTFFAELGAKVIKFENKTTKGDVTRSWRSANEDNNKSISAYYASVNYAKEIKLIDFKNKEDFKIVLKQIEEADIVISNFKKGDDIKFGLDYESIKKIKEDIIYGTISGFGETSKKVAYDVVLQAETGMMSINGEKGSKGLKMPIAFIDLFAAHQLKEGILIALLQKYKTNKGAKVSVSLYDAALASLANQASNYLMNNEIPIPIGSLHPNIAPYGETFQTKDKQYVVLAIGSDFQFQEICQVLKIDSISKLNKFKNNQARVINRTELKELLVNEFEKYNYTDLDKKFSEKNIPFGKIKNIGEVLESNTAQNLILEDEIEGLSCKRLKTAVFKIS